MKLAYPGTGRLFQAMLLVLAIFLSPLFASASSAKIRPTQATCVSSGGFVCRNDSLCQPASVACDGRRDCADGSDEEPSFCATYNCSESDVGRVECPASGPTTSTSSRRCVWASSLCDGTNDCPQGSDEDPQLCSTPAFNCSASSRVSCPSGVGCLYGSSLCNNHEDCADGSDEGEAFCASFNCSSVYTESCPSGSGCMAASFSTCDGIKDCADGSDESPKLCTPSFNCSEFSRIHCPSGYGCMGGPFGLCDGMKECADGSDEAPKFCTAFNCSEVGKVRCPSGSYCIPPEVMCNGIQDCTDGSDERPAVCNADFDCNATSRVLCPGGKQCVDPYLLCTAPSANDQPICFDGSDRDPSFCRRHVCPDSFSKCSDGVTCVADLYFCDGEDHCPDGSDEDPATCRNYNCSASGRFDCPSGGYCINSLCDICSNTGSNFSICPDGSDQKQQYCHLKPPQENCTIPIDCNTPMGICYAKGGGTGPVPESVPGLPPVPAVLADQNQSRSQGNVSNDTKAALTVVPRSQLGIILTGLSSWFVLVLAGLIAS